MKTVDIPAGTVQYREAGDPAGPPVVLLHGLLMNDTQWDAALPLLPGGFRYLLPVLPLGGHRIPVRPGTDLTLTGMVDLVGDVLDALELQDVTLVVSDWGGPLFLTDRGRDHRIARLVICPCEAYDNFPPGLPGRIVGLATRTTGTARLAMAQLRIPWLRNRFFMFGLMAKPIPQPVVEAWTDPGLADVRIRRDLLAYCRTRFDAADLIRATERLAEFRGEVLVLWSRNRVMPPAHAERLTRLTGGTLRWIEDAKVLVMMDQPGQTAREIGAFLTATTGRAGREGAQSSSS
jgi:pimeloyl-ACP methyl ester carboxylesterase